MLKMLLNFIEWHPYPVPRSAPLRSRLRNQLFDRLMCIAVTCVGAIELGAFFALHYLDASLYELLIFAVFLNIAVLTMFIEGLFPKMSAYVERRYPYTTGDYK